MQKSFVRQTADCAIISLPMAPKDGSQANDFPPLFNSAIPPAPKGNRQSLKELLNDAVLGLWLQKILPLRVGAKLANVACFRNQHIRAGNRAPYKACAEFLDCSDGSGAANIRVGQPP